MHMSVRASRTLTARERMFLAFAPIPRQLGSVESKHLQSAAFGKTASPSHIRLPAILCVFAIIYLAFRPSATLGGDKACPPILDMSPADFGGASSDEMMAACTSLIAKCKSAADLSRLHYMRGLLLVNAGKQKTALSDFRTANSISPGNPDVLLMLAFHENDSTKARKRGVESVIRARPNHVDSLLVMSYLCDEEEDLKAAAAWATRALAVESADLDHRSRAFHRRACVFSEMRDYRSCLADLERSIEMKPRPTVNPDGVYALRAQTLLFMGKPAEAIPSCQMALELNPKSVDATVHMWQAYHMLDRNKLAIFWAEKLIGRNPDSSWGYLLKANSCSALGLYDDAIEFGAKAVEKDVHLPEAYLSLAMGGFGKGQFDESIRLIDIAASLEVKGYEALLMKAFVVLNCPDPAFRKAGDALSMATKADKTAKSSDIRCVFVLAQALAEQGSYKEAKELVDRCVKWPGVRLSQRTLLEEARAAYEKHQPYRANVKLVLWRDRPYEP